MTGSLFISHASGDAKVAAELCTALEGRGFDCWLASRDVAPGENFQVAIVRAIRSARMLLLVFTGAANSSDEVAKELALASQAKIPVVPLKVEDVPPSEALAYEFATRQWIDFHTDWTRAVEQLSKHLSTTLGVEPGPVPPPAPPPPPQPSSSSWSGPPRPSMPPAGRQRSGDPRGEGSRDQQRDAAREEARERQRGAQYVREIALERLREKRAARRSQRVGPVQLLILMVIAFVIAITFVIPKLKPLLSPTPANATAPAPAPAANTAASNSEVPF